jgi:hypothetical protein
MAGSTLGGKRIVSRGTQPAVAQRGSTSPPAPGLELVARRTLLDRAVEAWLPLSPGDRPIVAGGESVFAGETIADRLREARLLETTDAPALRPGQRWTRIRVSASGEAQPQSEGELLFESDGRLRIATGEHQEPLESPVAGIVREVRAGVGIRLTAEGVGLLGAFALGGTARGRLDIAAGPDGELLPRSFDVGSAGAILVVGARIDAESLTRARAMGVRGIIVATLASKERRDFLASEARQRAALHRLPPLAVLVLHGILRRPIAGPVNELLQLVAGREVAIVGDPPRLVFDPSDLDLPVEPSGRVHVRAGPLAGRFGEWTGLAGLRRFAGGIHLEAGFVRFGDDPPVALPLADLERYD